MNKHIVLGLTGSVGMGKSTTAAMFAELGVPVWDADAAVHRLYAKDGAAVEAVSALCPNAVIDGSIDRARLSQWVRQDASNLKRLEAQVHPLVAQDRADFLASTKAPIVLLDVPLLFETGLDTKVDVTVTVSAPNDIQRSRVMARPGMTEDTFQMILSRQLPDAEKRARSDHVITTTDLESTRRQVQTIVAALKAEQADA